MALWCAPTSEPLVKTEYRVIPNLGSVQKLMARSANALHLERRGSKGGWTAFLFHHICDGTKFRSDDPLVAGLGVEVGVDDFEQLISVLKGRYRFVDLDEALDPQESSTDGRRPALICFDDAYASVPQVAVPILSQQRIPAMFFINPGLVDGPTLALDNLLAYAFNTRGKAAVNQVLGTSDLTLQQTIGSWLPQLGAQGRRELGSRIEDLLNISSRDLATDSALYLSQREVGSLRSAGVEVGNHTRDHVHCRSLTPAELIEQIAESAEELRKMSGGAVRAFAYPYGSKLDGTPSVRRTLADSGHSCAFFVGGRRNGRKTPISDLNRISIRETTSQQVAWEAEVLPRLRDLKSNLAGR